MKRYFSLMVLLLSLSLLVSNCGGGGGGGGGAPAGDGGTPATTTVSGKVTLSSTLGKPNIGPALSNKVRAAKSTTSYTPIDAGSAIRKVVAASGYSTGSRLAIDLTGFTVELYNADKPEWLKPIATYVTVDALGTYVLDKLKNASFNFNAYVDDDPIPSGNYTLIAYKFDFNTGKVLVAVQTIVKEFAGAASGQDLTAQDSDALPEVQFMLGLGKNTDGTYGSLTTDLPQNAAVQITFTMAMLRSTVDAVTIKDQTGTAVAGAWKISPNLLTLTFYPTTSLNPGSTYTVTVNGGTGSGVAKNVYSKALAATVKGYFRASAQDIVGPQVVFTSPTGVIKNNMPTTHPIRIGSDEPLDVNSLAVSSTPSIGAKPTVLFIGKNTSDQSIYEIVPSTPLALGTLYTINVSGGVDMAKNAMSPVSVQFNTEATSQGVTGTGATADAQLAVKDIFGKWVNAMNAKNSTLLTTYMTGDFFWLNDPENSDPESDTNKDGRLSLQEFTAMLDKWFLQIEHCGTTISGTANTITLVDAVTARLDFLLLSSSTNTTDPNCANNGPDPTQTLTAEMKNINSAWLMNRGADYPMATTTAFPSLLNLIALNSPSNGVQLAEASQGMALQPDFLWTAPTGTPVITTYLVAVVDNRAAWGETGWVALVDAASTNVKFSGTPGDFGGYMIPSISKDSRVLGFRQFLDKIESGGDYTWSVIGLHTVTLDDFRTGVTSPELYVAAASQGYTFSVSGLWKELTVTVAGSGGTTYPYQTYSEGYNVDGESSVTLTVTSPTVTTGKGCVNVDNYNPNIYPLDFTNGTASVTVQLGKGRNWFFVKDVAQVDTMGNIMGCYSDGGESTAPVGGGTTAPLQEPLMKQFNMFTTGGFGPTITFGSIAAKDCLGALVTLPAVDAWGNYDMRAAPEVCTVDVTVNIAQTMERLYANVWNDWGNGFYNKSYQNPAAMFSLTMPVFDGWNNIRFEAENCSTGSCVKTSNQFNVQVTKGSVYVPAITADVAGATQLAGNGNLQEAYYDAGQNTSVTITGVMQQAAGSMGSYNHNADPWRWVAGGSLTLGGGNTYSVTITLQRGWNYIDLDDQQGTRYRVLVYAANGVIPPRPDHVITQVDATTVDWTTYNGSFQYNAGSNCSVQITGKTKTYGILNVGLNVQSGTTYANEWRSLDPIDPAQVAFTGPDGNSDYTYTFTQPIYNGRNNININDANYNWQAVDATTACATMVVPFAITNVYDGANTTSPVLSFDSVNYVYHATGGKVTIAGTAKSGATIYAYNAGSNASTTSNGTFTLTIDVYTGWNYISINDGNNWLYPNVDTPNGSVFTPSINTVTVAPGAGGTYATVQSGGGVSDNYMNVNTDGNELVISGNVKVTGPGNYHVNGTYFPYNYGTTFTITVPLVNGNNYIDLYDSMGNWYYVSVYTTGGTGAPVPMVSITSPAHNAVASGTVAVAGTIDPSFAPTTVYGWVYDYVTSTSTYFSSDPADQSLGDLPVTVAAGAFSFNAPVNNGNATIIEAEACDAAFSCHGMDIYVNNGALGNNPYFWKAGAAGQRSKATATAHKQKFMEKIHKP